MTETTGFPERTDDIRLAQKWGWRHPTPEILDIAAECLSSETMVHGELLVKMGVITEEQRVQWLNSLPANTNLLSHFASRDSSVAPHVDRLQAYKAQYPYYSSLRHLSIHPEMKQPLVTTRAEALDACVMVIEDEIPVVVFSSYAGLIKFKQLGHRARDEDPIMKLVGRGAQVAVGARDEISTVLTSVKSNDDSSGFNEAATVWTALPESESNDETRFLTRLINHAITTKATDISLTPLRSGELVIQMRKNGDMISPKAISQKIGADLGRKMVAFLQSKSGANLSGTRQWSPTDGQITYRTGAGDCYLRLSFIPLNHLGEHRDLTSVSIRLLPRSEENISLSFLGIDDEVIEQIRFAMRMSQGLVLVVGPTNSGKSTTVAGAIGLHVDLFGELRKRISVEDPIERYLKGLMQINVPMHIKDELERFRVILRAIKRHDPDMLWIGEIRDKNSAQLGVDAAGTGHLVLSTLHANDSVMAFDVLAKTIDPEMRFQLIECLSLVMAQRLVKELCQGCCVSEAPTDAEKLVFKQYTDLLGTSETSLPSLIAHAHPGGCRDCSEGYVGLIPIYEVLPFTRKVKDAGIRMISGENSRAEVATGRTVTLLQSGLKLLKAQRVDLDAILV